MRKPFGSFKKINYRLKYKERDGKWGVLRWPTAAGEMQKTKSSRSPAAGQRTSLHDRCCYGCCE